MIFTSTATQSLKLKLSRRSQKATSNKLMLKPKLKLKLKRKETKKMVRTRRSISKVLIITQTCLRVFDNICGYSIISVDLEP